MKRLVFVFALALAFPTNALAGGIAARISAPPADLRVGDTWVAKVEVERCNGVRLTDVRPTVVLWNERTGRSLSIEPTRDGDAWVARIVFPTAGVWSYYADVNAYYEVQTVVVRPVEGRASAQRWRLPAGLALLSLVAIPAARRRRRV